MRTYFICKRYHITAYRRVLSQRAEYTGVNTVAHSSPRQHRVLLGEGPTLSTHSATARYKENARWGAVLEHRSVDRGDGGLIYVRTLGNFVHFTLHVSFERDNNTR